MCTYNGERYLQEQLDSIAAQDILPDELIVVDDRSKDQTVSNLQAFAERVSFPVRVIINETNLGSTKNFEKAISLCTGDIIVFSDQDDVWRSDRLSKTLNFLVQHPEFDAVFSDAETIDNKSQPVGRRIWEEVQFDKTAQAVWQSGEGYGMLFTGFVVTGATLAVRRKALQTLLPFPTHIKNLIHDGWIALVLALRGTIGFIDEPLISYRRHAQQQVGFNAPRHRVTLRERLTRDRREKLEPIEQEATRLRDLYDLLSARPDVSPARLDLLRRQRDHLQRRATLPSGRLGRLGPVWNEFVNGNYQRFNGYWMHTVLGDLLEN